MKQQRLEKEVLMLRDVLHDLVIAAMLRDTQDGQNDLSKALIVACDALAEPSNVKRTVKRDSAVLDQSNGDDHHKQIEGGWAIDT